MKDQKVEFSRYDATVLFTPTQDGERIIAFTVAGALLGGIVEVSGLTIDHGKAIETGETGAVEDVLWPQGELGFYRIVAGRAYLGQIDGEPSTVKHQIIADNLFETSAENN